MDPVSTALGIVSLGSLFSTCIECLGYFTDARDFDKDRNVLLVKLDFERNKLLIWGNAMGILNEPGESILTTLGQAKDAFQRSSFLLECIISLLTDAESLQQKYGLRNSDGTESRRNWSIVSKSNLEVFRPTLKRFLLRNPKETDNRKHRIWSKIKWAIFDKQKFQSLINDLKDLVDQLFMIDFGKVRPVDAAKLDLHMRADIELVDDLVALSLVQEASEDSYRAWSQHAASVIEASELGTADRRNFEELSQDLQWAEHEAAIPQIGRQRNAEGQAESSTFHMDTMLRRLWTDISQVFAAATFSDLWSMSLSVTLTEQCLQQRSGISCEPVTSIGSSKSKKITLYSDFKSSSRWLLAASPTFIFCEKIRNIVHRKLHPDEFEDDRGLLRKLAAMEDYQMSETEK